MAQRIRESTSGDTTQSVAGQRQLGRVSQTYAAHRRRRAPFHYLLLFLLAASATWAQGSPAVIAGAELVNIRRGPGTEFPPFATLSRGNKVEIQEMRGEWARVQTASGQYGHIRITFLAPIGEQPAAATPAEQQLPTVSTTSVQAKTTGTEAHPLEEGAPVTAAHLEETPAATPAAPTTADEIEKLHSDVARLSETVEQLQQQLEGTVPQESAPPLQTSALEGGSHVMMSTALLLTAVGLCVGWLFGNAYGRRQERGRRPRVRL